MAQFFDQRFTRSNLSQKMYSLENNFKDAIRASFDGDYLTKMLRGVRNTPKIKDHLVRGTIEMLKLDFSDTTKNNPEKFATMEQVVADNLGRDLEPCPAEDLFNVSTYISFLILKSKTFF